jgi:hypothetical protein
MAEASCPFAPGPRGRLLLMGAAVLAVVVPFLFWNQTWFGRELSNEEMTRYLRDGQRPRKIQHALSQLSTRIASGDPTAGVWFPDVVALAGHPVTEIRTTAAWLMGQGNRHAPFHRALLDLLRDPELMVRRNAALALVRFGDSSGRAELIRILEPYAIHAPQRGPIRVQLEVGRHVGANALLARIGEAEVRAPVAGRVSALLVQDGAVVEQGDRLLSLEPEPAGAWEALRALYLVGQPEDAGTVERYSRGLPDMPDRIRRQAALTAGAIRTRSERNPTR